MKKFNLSKWEAIQEQHNALRAAARKSGDEWSETREIYERSFVIFQHGYRDVGLHVFDLIQADARLSLAEIDEHLALMESDWPKAARRLNVPEEFFGKNGLLKIYTLMREMKKFQEAADRANEARRRFGACFNTLNDFARNYRLDEKSRLFPVADAQDPYENSHGGPTYDSGAYQPDFGAIK